MSSAARTSVSLCLRSFRRVFCFTPSRIASSQRNRSSSDSTGSMTAACAFSGGGSGCGGCGCGWYVARSGDVGGGVCAGGGGDAGEDKPAEKVLAIEGGDDGGVDDRTRRRLESPRKTLPMGFMQVGGDQGRGARRVQSPHAINRSSPPWTHNIKSGRIPSSCSVLIRKETARLQIRPEWLF